MSVKCYFSRKNISSKKHKVESNKTHTTRRFTHTLRSSSSKLKNVFRSYTLRMTIPLDVFLVIYLVVYCTIFNVELHMYPGMVK